MCQLSVCVTQVLSMLRILNPYVKSTYHIIIPTAYIFVRSYYKKMSEVDGMLSIAYGKEIIKVASLSSKTGTLKTALHLTITTGVTTPDKPACLTSNLFQCVFTTRFCSPLPVSSFHRPYMQFTWLGIHLHALSQVYLLHNLVI